MLNFFTPVLKIQKNRQVLRETDERMAKYSRRGLISNFLIFLLCMTVGTFSEQQPGLAITLTIGLLITTFLRGYLLFRFESLYPRAPAQWRTRYFYATLLGAAWWGLIVALITIIVGVNDEGPLLWLYTIVFFSMTANVFAPYKQFLTVYQSFGLIPGAFCLLFTGEMTGVIYGIVVFFFIWLLHHQSEQTADNYWERLEANDSLARKTESLEEEKRDTRATAQLHREYMLLLKKELESLLNARRSERRREGESSHEDRQHSQPNPNAPRRPKLQQLHTNVSDFYQILTKELDFESQPFNPRALIQFLASEYSSEAADKRIDVELGFSPNLPRLIVGDTQRLTQILDAVLSSMIKQLDEGTLFIDVEYLQERGKTGQLHMLASHQASEHKTLFNVSQTGGLQLNLDLALATGLAEAQGGDLVISTSHQGTQLRYRGKFANRITDEDTSTSQDAFHGKRILVVHENPRVLDAKRQDLSLLGCNVETETQFKRAIPALRNAINKQTPFSAVLFHSHRSPKATAEFSRTLLQESECKLIHQIIMGSSNAKESTEFADVIDHPYVHWLNKPAVASDFYACLWEVFRNNETEAAYHKVAVIAQGGSAEDLIEELTASGLNCQLFSNVKSAASASDSLLFSHFVFAYADDELITSYQKLHESHPTADIIAYDTTANALKHLQAGADRFIAAGTPTDQVTAKTCARL